MSKIEYDYWDIDECAVHYGIRISNEAARTLYDSITTSKAFLKTPNIETYLCALDSHFKNQETAEAEELKKCVPELYTQEEIITLLDKKMFEAIKTT